MHCHTILLVHCHGSVLVQVHTGGDNVHHSWSCCCIVVAEWLLLKLHGIVDGLPCRTRHPGELVLDQHAHERLLCLLPPRRLLPPRCLLLPRRLLLPWRLLLPRQIRQLFKWELRHLNVRSRCISSMLLVFKRW